MKIPLAKPFIDKSIKQKVLAVLESGHLTEGPVTGEFEEACRQYLGVRNAIAVTSCTVGLEMALRCLGIGPGDEVIVPDYTYPATASVVAIVGAKPVLVDVNQDTLIIDYDAVEAAISSRSKAVIPVSLFGNTVDYERLEAIKVKYGVRIVEDAACAFGSEYKGEKVGKGADMTVFSFHPRKSITTGEGGLITTENGKWASWLRAYKKFGISMNHGKDRMVFKCIGGNYKVSDILSAVGLEQMKVIGHLINKRRNIASRYIYELQKVKGVTLPSVTVGGKHSYQSFCIFVEQRDFLLEKLREHSIEAQIGTYALHIQPAFKDKPFCIIKGDLTASRHAYERCVALPIYHDMRGEDQQKVVDVISANLRV